MKLFKRGIGCKARKTRLERPLNETDLWNFDIQEVELRRVQQIEAFRAREEEKKRLEAERKAEWEAEFRKARCAKALTRAMMKEIRKERRNGKIAILVWRLFVIILVAALGGLLGGAILSLFGVIGFVIGAVIGGGFGFMLISYYFSHYKNQNLDGSPVSFATPSDSNR